MLYKYSFSEFSRNLHRYYYSYGITGFDIERLFFDWVRFSETPDAVANLVRKHFNERDAAFYGYAWWEEFGLSFFKDLFDTSKRDDINEKYNLNMFLSDPQVNDFSMKPRPYCPDYLWGKWQRTRVFGKKRLDPDEQLIWNFMNNGEFNGTGLTNISPPLHWCIHQGDERPQLWLRENNNDKTKLVWDIYLDQDYIEIFPSWDSEEISRWYKYKRR